MIFQQKLQDRMEWQDILKVVKGKNLQPRLPYIASISFRFKGKIKSFRDKQQGKVKKILPHHQLFNKG